MSGINYNLFYRFCLCRYDQVFLLVAPGQRFSFEGQGLPAVILLLNIHRRWYRFAKRVDLDDEYPFKVAGWLYK